ncbi:hypothetical protein BDU57DRAFT_250307 [Ampelomyces quisqualis]|uniref:Uncharacterized protein n=1 Tax=Ampelomyces quisqualis TaxID=50730 RepID=A0A6A5QSJ8_AMPQU|nr:hypothetical protein BDU57DRAFT_250307 [Ampelomyces quisqualis]
MRRQLEHATPSPRPLPLSHCPTLLCCSVTALQKSAPRLWCHVFSFPSGACAWSLVPKALSVCYPTFLDMLFSRPSVALVPSTPARQPLPLPLQPGFVAIVHLHSSSRTHSG